MIHSLIWKSIETKEDGGCMFFKSNILEAQDDIRLVEYEINITPEITEYELFLMYSDGTWHTIGKYPNFESACLAANKHYPVMNLKILN